MKFAIALPSAVAESPPISLSATAATTPNDVNKEGCPASKIGKCVEINNEHELYDILKTRSRVFVLFFASWCPFSARFLPIFERYAKGKAQSYVRITIDDKPNLMEKYSVEVFPTVIFFENGSVSKRLDGVTGLGLSEKQLTHMINECGISIE